MSEALRLAELLTRTPRILVIDDEPIIQMAFERLKRYYDLDIVSAYSPDQGLHALNQSEFDAVFLDMKFEAEKDGMDVIRALNTREDDAAIVIMSGSINLHNVMAEANQLGVISFMIKPVAFTTQLLVAVLRRLKIRLMPPTQPYLSPDSSQSLTDSGDPGR